MKLKLGDRTLEAAIGSEIKREDLHGRTFKRVVHGDDTLEKGYLRPNGELLLSRDIVRQDMDPLGTPIEDPKRIGEDGKETAALTPSEETGLELTPGTIADLAEYAVESVRPVETVLEEGVYHTKYAGPRSVHEKDAVLLVKKDGAFLLIGDRRAVVYVGQIIPYEFFTTECEQEAAPSDEDLLSSFAA